MLPIPPANLAHLGYSRCSLQTTPSHVLLIAFLQPAQCSLVASPVVLAPPHVIILVYFSLYVVFFHPTAIEHYRCSVRAFPPIHSLDTNYTLPGWICSYNFVVGSLIHQSRFGCHLFIVRYLSTGLESDTCSFLRNACLCTFPKERLVEYAVSPA